MKASEFLKRITGAFPSIAFCSSIPEYYDFETMEDFVRYVEEHPRQLVMAKNLETKEEQK